MVLVLLAFFAVLCAVAVAVAFIVIAAKFWAAESRGDDLRHAVSAGDACSLEAWSPEMLPWLSKDAVGSSSYYRPMGGALTSKLALTLFSAQGAALVAIIGEVTRRKGRGRIDVLVRGTSMVLQLEGARWIVFVNGGPLGAIEPTSGRLDDVRGMPVGFCRPSAGGAQVELRGVNVGWIEAGAELHEARVANPRPLLRLAAPVTEPEPVLWLLAAIAFTLVNQLMVSSSGLMSI
ncbi:MAG: hypothetical protein KC776_26135 [Myxococcales bacterium]|nr:hypothetical protein [Myxococcales bacterium]MCB9575572.1 hypothetical protein [Polyangiaceae bacterium]